MKNHRHDGSPEDVEIDLGAKIRHLIAEEVRTQVARQLAGAKSSPDSEQLLSVAEVAKRMGMSVSFVRAAVRDGRLPSERVGRAVRIRAAALTALTQATGKKAVVDPTEQAERILGLGRGKR